MRSNTQIRWKLISKATRAHCSKRVLSKAPYPLTLTAGHVAFAWLASTILRRFAPDLFYKGSTTTPATAGNQSQEYAQIPTQSAAAADTHLQMEQDSNPAKYESKQDARGEYLPTASMGQPSDLSRHRRPAWMQFFPAQVDASIFWTRLAPAGALFAASLGLSNAVYLYLSVTTIQIIKSGSPIAVMSASFLFGLKQPSLALVGIILLISCGAGVASFGAADFNTTGVTLQILAILCVSLAYKASVASPPKLTSTASSVEALRLTLTQTLLHGCGFGPLESINATSPICLAALSLLVLPIEGLQAFSGLFALGPRTLLSNLALSFALNVASVFLIDLSSLVMSLTKVAKDILLIVGGTRTFGSSSMILLHGCTLFGSSTVFSLNMQSSLESPSPLFKELDTLSPWLVWVCTSTTDDPDVTLDDANDPAAAHQHSTCA